MMCYGGVMHIMRLQQFDKNIVLFAFETVTQCGLRDIKLINW